MRFMILSLDYALFRLILTGLNATQIEFLNPYAVHDIVSFMISDFSSFYHCVIKFYNALNPLRK